MDEIYVHYTKFTGFFLNIKYKMIHSYNSKKIRGSSA